MGRQDKRRGEGRRREEKRREEKRREEKRREEKRRRKQDQTIGVEWTGYGKEKKRTGEHMISIGEKTER